MGGSNKSETKSTGEGASWFENMGQSFGMNDAFSSAVSDAFSQSSSQSTGTSGSFVAGEQMPFLQNLWKQGAGITNPAAAQKTAGKLVGGLMPGLQGAFGSTTALSDPTKQIASQEKSLQAGLGQLFRQEMMPSIKSDAIASGGFGGGRQGVAEGRAVGQLADAFAKARGDIVAGANATALGAGELAGQLGGQITNLGMMPTMAGFQPLQAMAGLLGSPIVLQEALNRASSTATSGSKGTQTSVSTGRTGSVTAGRGASAQKQKSGSKASGWDIGMPKSW